MQASTSTPELTTPTRLLSSSFINSERRLLLISLSTKILHARCLQLIYQPLCYLSSFITQSDLITILFQPYKSHPLFKLESPATQLSIFAPRENKLTFITQSLHSYAKENQECVAL